MPAQRLTSDSCFPSLALSIASIKPCATSSSSSEIFFNSGVQDLSALLRDMDFPVAPDPQNPDDSFLVGVAGPFPTSALYPLILPVLSTARNPIITGQQMILDTADKMSL